MSAEDIMGKAAIIAIEKFAEKGLDKISNAIGVVFPFHDTKRIAIQTYIDEIQKSDRVSEEKLWVIYNLKSTIKQLNNQIKIAEIAYDSAKEGTVFSEESKVDDEWLDRYLDSAKFVSDEEMQSLWGKILAGEFEKPNSVPIRIMRVLSETNAFYAKIFENVCHLAVNIVPVYADNNTSIPINCVFVPMSEFDEGYLGELQVTYNNVKELETLGLLSVDNLLGFKSLLIDRTAEEAIVQYGDKTGKVKIYQNEIPVGQIKLTEVGECIRRFITPKIINQHFEEVINYIKEYEIVYDVIRK